MKKNPNVKKLKINQGDKKKKILDVKNKSSEEKEEITQEKIGKVIDKTREMVKQ